MNGRIHQRWLRLKRALHLPRGIHRRQFVAALLACALPAALIPLAHAGAGSSVGRLLWQPVHGYFGATAVQRALTGQLDVQPALYAVSASSGLAASVDDGASWTSVSAGLPQGRWRQTRVIDVAVDPVHPGVMYAAVDSPASTQRPMLYWTVDGGLHWQPRANLGRERVRALAFAPGSSDLYVATSNDVRIARAPFGDTAASPQERYARDRDDLQYEVLATLESGSYVTCLSVLETPGGTVRLYVGVRGGGLRVLGQESAPQPDAGKADTYFVLRQASVYAVAGAPGRPQRLCAGTNRGVYYSADEGRTWRRAGGSLGSRSVLCLYRAPSAPDTLLAGVAGAGVYYSQDTGETWEPLGWGLGRASVRGLALLSRGPASVLYAATNAGLWRLALELTP